MLNLGAIKLRRWRLFSLGECPTAGRGNVITLEEAGLRAGVGKAMMGHLESGLRTPSLALAMRLQEMGVCAPEDWTRKATCIACGIALDHEPTACRKADCEWSAPEEAGSAKVAA